MRPREPLRLLSSIVCAAMIGAAGPRASLAEPAPDVASAGAKESFDSAQRLFDQGQFAEALVLFQRAYSATGSPNAHLMMARSLSALGRLPDAYDAMLATLREATALSESQPKYAPTRDAAAAELALLDRRVGKLIIALTEPPPPGAGVTLNGRPVPAWKLGALIAVEPGSMVVEVKTNGVGVTRRSIGVGAGETKTVAIAYPKTPEKGSRPAVAVVASSSAVRDQAGPGNGVRMAGFALGGVGVAGMVVFGMAGAAADSKYAELERECGSERCADPIYGPAVDNGKALDTVANAGLVVGLVGLVGGGALIAIGGPRSPTRAAVSVGLSTTSAKVALKGSF